jgi:hypothetical protein
MIFQKRNGHKEYFNSSFIDVRDTGKMIIVFEMEYLHHVYEKSSIQMMVLK